MPRTVGVSRDWLFASVNLSSTLPPTHVVRTFAPRVPRIGRAIHPPNFSRDRPGVSIEEIEGRSGRSIEERKLREERQQLPPRSRSTSAGLKPDEDRTLWRIIWRPDEDRARAACSSCSRGRDGSRGCPIIMLIDASAFLSEI